MKSTPPPFFCFEDLATDFFSDLFCCRFSFLLVISFYVLRNAGRAGLHLVGGVRQDLRVQSYHLLMVFSEIYLFLNLFFYVFSLGSVFFLLMYKTVWMVLPPVTRPAWNSRSLLLPQLPD